MPGDKRTHDENLNLVCAVCTNTRGQKCSRKVSPAEEEAIKKNVLDTYSRSDPRFPHGICEGCHLDLRQRIGGLPPGQEYRTLHLADNYDAGLSVVTRSMADQSCCCKWCERASLNGLAWIRFKESSKKKKTKSKPERLCSICFHAIYRGSSHTQQACKSRKAALNNIQEHVEPKMAEQLATRVIREKEASLGSQGDVVKLSSSEGSPISVRVGGKDMSVSQLEALTKEEITTMMKELDLSDRKMKNFLRFLRVKWGRQIVDSYIREEMGKSKGIFAEYFSTEIVTFTDSDGGELERPFTWCHNIGGFLETLAYLRGENWTESLPKFGFDSGKGHLRMTLSLLSSESSTDCAETKRVKRSDSIVGAGTVYSVTGRKKVQIVASAPQV